MASYFKDKVMNTDKYILDGHKAVVEKDLMKWAAWFENANRAVGRTEISKDVSVSTVFLGLDHQFGEGPPLIFETMVFGGPLDQQEERYSTWEEAEAGHKHWVEKAKGD
jgi:hypothetical protein